MCECPFMDGAYQFDVRMEHKDLFSVTLVERHVDEKETLLTADVDCELLIGQLLAASEIVVHTCKSNGWNDDDMLNLEKLMLDAKGRL